MKKAVVFFLMLATLTAVSPAAAVDENAIASSTPKSAAKKRPRATAAAVTPAPTPTESPRRSWWSQLFGRRPKPTPTPVATPTPRPKKRTTKPRTAPATSPEETKSVASPTPEKKTSAGAAAVPAPSPKQTKKSRQSAKDEAKGEAMGDQVPFVSQPGTNGGGKDEAKTIGGGDEETKQKARFQEVKSKALEDKSIQTLQDKADNAADDAEQRKASKDYYKALYGKMRKIDPSLKERIDRMENVTLKRLEQPGAK